MKLFVQNFFLAILLWSLFDEKANVFPCKDPETLEWVGDCRESCFMEIVFE